MLENAEYVDFGPFTSFDFLDDWYWERWFEAGKTREEWRLTVGIKLKDGGYEKVIEAIEHLQTLDFVRRAEPSFPNIRLC